MPVPKTISLAKVIRNRRRALGLTQQEVAKRIGISPAYVGHLELAKRLPSQKVLVKTASLLGLDRWELFILANPDAAAIVSASPGKIRKSCWNRFLKDIRLRELHHVTDEELKILSRVAAMGEVRSTHDFIHVLAAIRNALGKNVESQ